MPDPALRTHRHDPRYALSLVLLSLLTLAPGFCQAQERAFPYELAGRDKLLVPAGLASTGLGFYLLSRGDPITLAEITALDRSSVNGFDRRATHNWAPEWEQRADVSKNVILAASVLLSGAPLALASEWTNTVTVGTIFLETFTLVLGVTNTTKALAGRRRPFAYNTAFTPEERYELAGPDHASVNRSFISGHTSMAFAAAVLMSTVYADTHGPTTMSKVVWASSLSLAAFTGYARVAAGVHFPTDVIAGAAVGAAIGYWIPSLHRVGSDQRVSVSAGPGSVQFRIGVGSG